ncbi:MAG: bifunctional metallophosphatase/5'-nucleotidase [Oscillibacter sp.]|nr:bifunctional UDP-sugar hydrolase/5'-nucleotidase [uncultured Oscillibacter sp.]MCI8812959.1 bifunctional metallophosphatase/5'-nucleotidase [Oscillibacter sp.]
MKKLPSLLLALLLIVLCVSGVEALPPSSDFEATILFTHDLHSHFLPQRTEDGGESGGYARLKTAIDRERARHPNALLVDGGDFSIGSLIQTLYTTQAAELRTMGALGYDAATLGNHEFDHTGAGLARMLNAVADSGERLPALVEANYAPAPDNPDRDVILAAMDNYGVAETLLFDRDGVTYGLFGLMGVDSHDCAPTSGFVLENMAQAAQRCVEALEAQGAELILCLSHSGTESGEGEDYALAKAVDGIDVIISGHTHTTLAEPIVVNDTYIVSAGPYCRNLGSITLEKDGDALRLTDYHLTPIDETLPHDPDTAALVEGWKAQVGETYLKRYGLTYDQVLAHSDFSLAPPRSGIQEGNALGELVSDAFLYAANAADRAAGREPQVTVAVTADGVLRAPLAAGDITVSQVFDVLSMGVGSDDTSGFPLVAVYLTGAELRDALEVDASVTPIMPAAQLYCAGIQYSFNTHRMFFNRVTDAQLYEETLRTEPAATIGSGGGQGEYGYTAAHVDTVFSEIDDNQLYRVVTGMYSAQMLGTVKGKSMGLLSLEPKMADGTPVTDFNNCILRDGAGNEIKEWYALAMYLQALGPDGIPARYSAPDGRKTVSRSWNPVELVKSPNWITLLVLAAILLLTIAVVSIVRFTILRKCRRKQI